MNPVVPNAARISGTGGPYYLNSVIGFRCYTGYVINGSTHITCNENSIWEPEPPKCLGLCWNSPLLSYAELETSTTQTSFVEGTTLKLKCRAGYEPIPGVKDTITCKGKVWEKPVPFCTPISCGNPGLISNGNIKGETFFFGFTVTYVCSSGYKIKDGKTRKCQANGTWSLPIPECEVQTCHIPNITIGLEYSPVKLQYQHGENVTYTCAEGYHLIGQPTSTCNYEGTWSSAEPFCREMCHAPPDLEFAYPRINQRSDTTFLQWDKVLYDCRYGYILNTQFENSLTCLGQFHWSEPENFCTRIFCGPPKNVTHAEFKAKDYFVDSEAFYECNKGYQMVTKYNSIKCLINGQWSTPVPRCKVQTCPPPEAPKNGLYSNKKDKYNYMESVTYICKNLTVVGEASVSCTTEGNWTSGAPECKAVCTSPPDLGYGKLVEEYSKQLYFDIDTTIKYDCQPGFVAVENKKPTVTCLSNNKWSKPEVFCKRVSCGNPGNIDHAEMEAKDFLFGSQVMYTCKSGYNMISRKNYRECQANGTWSVDLPVCKESICDKIWQLQEEARMCTSTPDDWIKYLQVHYLFLQIESLKLDIEIKKKQLG